MSEEKCPMCGNNPCTCPPAPATPPTPETPAQ